MATADLRELGRDAFERRAWGDAYRQLSGADEHAELTAVDLERLGIAALLVGHDDAGVHALERAHGALLADGEVAAAVRCGFWIGLTLLQRGQHAPGGGWMLRCERMLDEASLDCVERGFLLIPRALKALESGDASTALPVFDEIAQLAERFGDADLVALGRLGRGRALVRTGEAARGIGMLDEAMVGVTTGEVSPIAAGIVYCAVIITCREVCDWRRAQEWTAALSSWCETQQELRPYRGQCLVHRSEIMQLKGEWADAMEEVQQACVHLSDPPGDPVLGMARYQLAELLRLQGAYARAEEAYRQASQCGHTVQPGLALLRLAQDRLDDATAAIRHVVDDADDHVERARILAAFVEITLAAGDVDAARSATDGLDQLAAAFDSSFLRAAAARGRGEVLLADGDAPAACRVLRAAWRAWQELDAPYEAARVRVLVARACGQLGDHDTAEMELDAARAVFEALGAAPALARVEELSRRPAPGSPAGVTRRELEVLRLVAAGNTNREIAGSLVISEKTVARHLTNIFAKLGVSSRSAATSYAYEHDLMRQR
ncbi:MAG: LuxR C-terminal-related transcriptional regulator [Acidimicrobiales bacterium]